MTKDPFAYSAIYNKELEKSNRKALAKKYHVKWYQRVWLLIEALILAHVGVLIIVALYYALFEVNPTMTHWWHTTVPDGTVRHNIRDVAEGVLGGFAAKAVLWNHFTKGHQKVGKVFLWFKKIHIPPWIPALLLSLVFAAIGYIAATLFLDHVLNIHVHSPTPAGGVWTRTQTIWNSNWDKKLIAFVVTFIAVRPMHFVFDDMQGYFAGRKVVLKKEPHIWHPLTFKFRYRYLLRNQSELKPTTPWVDWVVRFGFFACIGLAAWGYYILTYVA